MISGASIDRYAMCTHSIDDLLPHAPLHCAATGEMVKGSLPRAHAQGVKQSVCLSVVVVVGTKIARSRVLGICASSKHNQSVDIGEKLVYTRFELLKKAY